VPRAWRRGADRYGTIAWNNGLPELGRASFAAQAVEMPEGADAAGQAQRFIEGLKALPGQGAEVIATSVDAPVPSRVGERDALKVHGVLTGRSATTHVVAFFVPRGELVYQLVFKYPGEFPRYAHVVEQMESGIRFEERRVLREARAQALLFPNSPARLGRLGAALRRDGDAGPAVEALTLAVNGEPSRVELRRELSLALLATGDVEAACEASKAAVLYGPDDPDSLEVDARCEVARGNPRRALERLTSARTIIPQDERLKAAEERLRATLHE
jgi:rhomboid protease GluP